MLMFCLGLVCLYVVDVCSVLFTYLCTVVDD